MAEAERIKPRNVYVEEAIQLALESRWAEALATNQALIERHGADEEAYNRIGKAQTELGHPAAAVEAYAHTLQLNPLNVIAQKNTHKLAAMLEAQEKIAGSSGAIDVDAFAEEPGKSVATVLRPPSEKVTATVVPGDVVDLEQANGQLEVRTSRGALLGGVDPKLSRRLIGLIEKGNRYTAAVARVEPAAIEIILREVYQSSANAGKSSFPVSRAARAADFRPYAKDSLLDHRGTAAPDIDSDDGDDGFGLDTSEDADLEGMQTTEDFDDAAGALTAADDTEDVDLSDDLEGVDDDEDDDDDDDDDSDPNY